MATTTNRVVIAIQLGLNSIAQYAAFSALSPASFFFVEILFRSVLFISNSTMKKRQAAAIDEASRMKLMAEEKYEKSEFTLALKYAKRAQRLEPNLGGLSEMVTALRILRAAEERAEGLGSHDWYKILQLESFSSVDVVKRRYKKLALALHPDKSSFVGCGEAFKLVGDAFRCLVCVERRKEFDLKLRVWIQDEEMRKGEEEEVVERFQSRCDECGMLCRFERKYVGQSLICVGCRKSFVGVDVEGSDDSGVTLSAEDSDGDVNGDDDDDDYDGEGEEQGGAENISEADDGMMGAMKKEKESIIVYSRRKKLSDVRGNSVREERSDGEVISRRLRETRMEVVGEEITLAELQLEAKKRKKSLEKESMEKAVRGRSFDSGNGKGKRELRGDDLKNEPQRGSEKNVANDEEDSETEVLRLLALKKKKEDVAKAKSMSKKSCRGVESVEHGHLEGGNYEIMTVEDSDFYDFDKDRVEKSFKQGQVWAIYDDKDGMPRHYGLIDEVVSINPFEVKMSWLDLQMNSDEMPNITSSQSHISCGRFKVDKKTAINSVNFFSHVENCDRAAREVYRIYPKKGSVWALYNEDDTNQNGGECLARDERNFSIVVFLTSYSEMHGLSMAYLEKVDGYRTLFKRQQIGARAIIWMEKVNVRLFSHQIPARKLSQAEGPMFQDCWELDPASLPPNLLSNGYGK